MGRFKINKDFIGDGAKGLSEEDLKETHQRRKEIEDKITQSGILKKYLQISKYMFQMLNDYRRGLYKDVPWLTISTLAFILLYVLNPLDLIPDFIPVIGYIDDVTVFAAGLNFIQKDLKRYLDWKYGSEIEEDALDVDSLD